MTQHPGMDIDDLRLPAKEALSKAAELQFRTIEFGAVCGELSPEQLSGSGRRHLGRILNGLGLTAASITADLPGLRFTDGRNIEERIVRTCRILDMAADLGIRVVTASLGAVTNPESGVPSPVALEALRRIGEHADARGRVYALRPSLDGGHRIERLMNELSCPAIHVGIDPAAMVMAGNNPLAVVERFAGRIAVAHLRDATVGLPQQSGHETRLGEGDVDLVTLMEALDDCDFAGPRILRRLESQTPASDLLEARTRMQQLLHSK